MINTYNEGDIALIFSLMIELNRNYIGHMPCYKNQYI